MNKDIILVGAFSEMIELCISSGYRIIGYVDTQKNSNYSNIGLYLGTDANIEEIYKKYGDIPVVISPDLPKIRMNLYQTYKKAGFKFQTVISPGAHISPTATIGLGSVIQYGAFVSANVNIGSFVKLNVNANIMHDCNIGDFVTVAPNAVVLGRVNISSLAYIGANATVLPYRNVAGNTVVGAGAVVTTDIPEDRIAKGVPARF